MNKKYRLLKDGDIIQKGDEFLTDDTVTWKEFKGDTILKRYGQPAFYPGRREIKDVPVSVEEIVGNIIRENGFPQLTGGYGVTHFDLKKFVKAGEQNHSKRTKPVIDAVKELKMCTANDFGLVAYGVLEALKTLEENEV